MPVPPLAPTQWIDSSAAIVGSRALGVSGVKVVWYGPVLKVNVRCWSRSRCIRTNIERYSLCSVASPRTV